MPYFHRNLCVLGDSEAQNALGIPSKIQLGQQYHRVQRFYFSLTQP